MGLLSREQILGAKDSTFKDVEVPEWGGTVRVRTMTGEERDAYEEIVMQSGEKQTIKGLRARLCVMTVVDEHGERLFKDEADLEAVGKKNSRALQRVSLAAQEMNALTDKALKELAKNSASVPGGASSSV